MKPIVRNLGLETEFRLIECEERYVPVLKTCAYAQDDDGFFKRFPSDTPDLESIGMNFIRNAIPMFDQLGYFAPIPWEQALEVFCRRMAGSGIDWWLTGSCAACIRGVDLAPHDVDIMMDSRDCDRMIALFHGDWFEPLRDTSGWVTKDFGVLFLHARIDIAGDPRPDIDMPNPVDFGLYAQAHLEMVDWRGFRIAVPPLNLQRDVNRRRGRIERAEKIEAMLRTL